jgi:hypothetical protein
MPAFRPQSFGVAVRMAASLVLLFAALMKWGQLPILDRTGGGLFHKSSFVVGLIVFEVVLAIWLAIGIWPKWATWLPSACFAAFALVALYQAFTGADSCGCFGRIKVNPWVTFGLDLTLAAALWVWQPGDGERSEDRRLKTEDRGWQNRPARLRYRVAIVGCAALLALGLSLWRLPSARAAGETSGMVRAGSLTILEPEKWIGKSLPLSSDIDVGDRLRIGQWLVVLYHADCSTCREAIPAYDLMSSSHAIAIVEMPPYASSDEKLTSPGSKALIGQLSDNREWFATTPVVLLLDDGVVRDVSEGEPADAVSVDWANMKLNSR